MSEVGPNPNAQTAPTAATDPSSATPHYPTENLARLDEELGGRVAGSTHIDGPRAVGRYHILERIGQGGMGAVYRAEQRSPIERIVALKLVKPGLDTPEIVRRFESERQALARMDHPNIAKVLDAGADPVTGRPYFVMEYVPGLPITRYCDEQRLNNRQRLDLFIQVCEAVAHAHQKMIVHRDLKPSNILVRSDDGPAQAQVKVIDFGIAKALVSQTDLAATLITEVGQMIGTLDYMSPEQARSSGSHEDVDTRSDIYSLGVVLYELLTGALPFDPQKLRSGGFSQVERMICEVDPPRPSTRLGGMGDGTGEVAQRRQTQLQDLTRELKRELDWIPLKAMRKERDDRYTTAAELADDVRNYLSGRPLRAAPESRAYRARKFLRRNRVAVSVSLLVFILLVAGIAGTSWQAIRAERERRLAQLRFEDIRQLSSNLIFKIHGDVAKLPGSQSAVDQLLAVALEYLQKLNADTSDDPDVVCDASVGYQRLGDLQGSQFANNRGDVKAAAASYVKARELARRAISLRSNDYRGRMALVGAEIKLGDADMLEASGKSALEHYLAAQEVSEKLAAERPAELAPRVNAVLAAQRVASASEDRTGEALKVHERGVALARKLVADFPNEDQARQQLTATLHQAYTVKLQAGDLDGALASLKELVELQEKLVARDSDDSARKIALATSLQSWARLLELRGQKDEAMTVQTRCLELARRLHEQDATDARVQMILGSAQLRFAELKSHADRFDEARPMYDAAIATYRDLLKRTPSHSDAQRMLLYTLSALGDLLAMDDKRPEALACHREAIALLEPMVEAQPNDVSLVGGLAFTCSRLGMVLIDSGDPRGALVPIRRSVELNERLLAADPANAMIAWNQVEARVLMGDAYAGMSSVAEARTEFATARELALALRRKNLQGGSTTIFERLDQRMAALEEPATTRSAATQPG